LSRTISMYLGYKVVDNKTLLCYNGLTARKKYPHFFKGKKHHAKKYPISGVVFK